jgi:putative heme iron utilization protein
MKKITIEEATKIMLTFTDDIESVNLATVSTDGEPFASYSPYVEDEKGNYYVFISTAVMHSHNMNATKKAYIMFLQDESKASHIYARQRLSFKAEVEKFKEDDKRANGIFELFDKKFGDRVSFFSMMKDSRIYKLIPKDGKLVLGFGSAYNLSKNKKILGINDKGHSSSHDNGLKEHSHSK